jgi:hypothetical protein
MFGRKRRTERKGAGLRGSFFHGLAGAAGRGSCLNGAKLSESFVSASLTGDRWRKTGTEDRGRKMEDPASPRLPPSLVELRRTRLRAGRRRERRSDDG